MQNFTVSSDGFLWFAGRKLPCKLTPGGLEFCDRNPQRVELAGSAVFTVPFTAVQELLSTYDNNSIDEGQGEQ
jgi:hypothetical protein